ncbi:MAG: hypothetical protein H0V17_32170 [Deltaproteobacteria bacterium]|nr:hypothetical protein [Deltaproteobacteria bacterium]
MIRATLIVLALVLALGACGDKTGQPNRPDTKAPDTASGVAAFETVRAVLQHPRCQNCHPAGDAPLQGDEGRVHQMNVLRGPEGRGMAGAECTTCHGPANPSSNYGLKIPPGVSEGWHMPKPEEKLVFVGVAPRALCEQVKDPARNGGKDMAALRKHLDTPLVLWGWSPGFGRAPVSTPYKTFIDAWELWAQAGTPCPE